MIGQSVDTGRVTLRTLLEVAIRLETAAREFYEGLAERFAHCPEVAAFWRVMAKDEACHGNRLTEWGASTDGGRLAQAVDPKMLRMGEKLLGTSVAERLDDVRSLDDAYETAHELESSEINAIFRFFITEFGRDPRVITILMQDLDQHAERLMTEFPAAYKTRVERAKIQAVCP
jgi:rubrerythrin